VVTRSDTIFALFYLSGQGNRASHWARIVYGLRVIVTDCVLRRDLFPWCLDSAALAGMFALIIYRLAIRLPFPSPIMAMDMLLSQRAGDCPADERNVRARRCTQNSPVYIYRKDACGHLPLLVS